MIGSIAAAQAAPDIPLAPGNKMRILAEQRDRRVKALPDVPTLKGNLKIFFDPDHELKETVVKARDFVYIPHGEIHGFMNMSPKESAELIAVCGEVGSKEEAQTLYIEKPWA